MKISTIVVFLILSFSCRADDINKALQTLEHEWAQTYYAHEKAGKNELYSKLLGQTNNYVRQYPGRAEFYFWKAILIATNAEFENGLTALKSIDTARGLLLKSIKLNPSSLNGSALVTLGTLYYMVPGWPISFGDNQKAEKYLKKALQINPTGIDTNYYYANFLLKQNQTELAYQYYQAALDGPIRPEQVYADKQLKAEVAKALAEQKTKPARKPNKVVAAINPNNPVNR